MYRVGRGQLHCKTILGLPSEVFATLISMQCGRWDRQRSASWRNVTAHGRLRHYLICITRLFKCRQRSLNRDRVEWIEYLRPHLYLQTLATFIDASSDFIIIRRLIREVVHAVVWCFLEAVVNIGGYRKFFIAMVLGLLMVANWQIASRSRVWWSTEMDRSLRHRFLVILRLQFRAAVVLLLRQLRNRRVWFHAFVSLLATVTLRLKFGQLSTAYSVILGV